MTIMAVRAICSKPCRLSFKEMGAALNDPHHKNTNPRPSGRLQIDSFFLAIRVEFAEFAISYLKMRFFPLMDIIITIHAFD